MTIKHQCFNAETIGDAYIAVSGGPEGNDPITGATNIAAFALDAIDAVEKLDFKDKKIKIRIGMTLFATLLSITVLLLHTLFSQFYFDRCGKWSRCWRSYRHCGCAEVYSIWRNRL